MHPEPLIRLSWRNMRNFDNWGTGPFQIKRGERIAQMIIAPVSHILWEPVPSLPSSNRGHGGFGHTGIIQDKTPK
jgi:dUTPase